MRVLVPSIIPYEFLVISLFFRFAKITLMPDSIIKAMAMIEQSTNAVRARLENEINAEPG